MLMIRLARFGARKQPYYRVVVIEKDRARNGRSIEVVGTYNPRTNPATVDLKRERIDHWTSNGAQLSERVAKLLAAYSPSADRRLKRALEAHHRKSGLMLGHERTRSRIPLSSSKYFRLAASAESETCTGCFYWGPGDDARHEVRTACSNW